jgi:hypothetical protein
VGTSVLAIVLGPAVAAIAMWSIKNAGVVAGAGVFIYGVFSLFA